MSLPTAPVENAVIFDPSGQRFGRLIKNYGVLGELRRQKKAPHTEVMYIWVQLPPPAGAGTVVLRSINNCNNDQLTQAIRFVGEALADRTATQQDAEFLLDLLYKELGKRVK